MNFIVSLLYAPLVFMLLKYYDVRIISIMIFSMSIVWLFLLKNKKDISIFFPLFYLCIALFAFFADAFLVLKMLPLLLAMFYALFILLSYFKNESYIMHFAQIISKEPIGEAEKNYIHASTLFWFFVSLVNVLVHIYFYLESNLTLWLYYSSFGWYIVFMFAGVLQFLHRRYVFLRRGNV